MNSITISRYVLDVILDEVDTGSEIFCMAKANLAVAYFQNGNPHNVSNLLSLSSMVSL